MAGNSLEEVDLRLRLLESVTSAIGGRWDPDLHPRGKDGKFIKVFGLINLTNMPGFRHGQRGSKNVQGTVTEIIPDPDKPGDPIIRVKVTDPRWDAEQFGETYDARSDQVSERLEAKGDLGGPQPPTPKAHKPTKPKPAPVAPKPKPKHVDTGEIPPRAPTPLMTPSPDGPNLAPLTTPPDWETMGAEARLAWLKTTMEADYTAFRGEPTLFDFTGFDSGVAFNLANTYRELTNWDPDTARRVDAPILSTGGAGTGLSPNAIAVAHPGTAHVGGIGPKIKQSAMVFGEFYFSKLSWWKQQQAQSQNQKIPWSTSSKHADPSVTLIHEFAHQRQFRFLDVAMRDVGAAWSPVVRDDGFGLVPDSSNWKETQDIRYAIPKATPTKYGQSKTSEGFAEAWATRLLGESSPKLDTLLDTWDAYMGLPLMLPSSRYPNGTKSFDDLTLEERGVFWTAVGPFLGLPGMREHYPDTAAEYDAWVATTTPVAAHGAQR